MPSNRLRSIVGFGIVALVLLILTTTSTKHIDGVSGDSSDRPTSRNQIRNTDLIQMVYHEDPESADNLRFFLKHALHDNADFIIIINGDDLSVEIPKLPNVSVIRRPNTCYDLGAHGEVLDGLVDFKKYKRFILLNSTVRGPFLPYWSHLTRSCWSSLFFDRINDQTKLIGLTANCRPHSGWNEAYNLTEGLAKHIQSAFFVADQIAMDLLMPKLRGCFTDMVDAVVHSESTLASVVLKAGYGVNIFSAQRMAKGLELNNLDYWKVCDNIDPNAAVQSGEMEIHPYDVIFPKTNRLSPTLRMTVNTLTTWMNASGYTSYDACQRL